MDGLDQKLFADLSIDIDIPIKLDNIIKQTLYQKSNKKYSIMFNKLKTIAVTFILGIIIMASAVYAGIFIYEKVWKEPIRYNNTYELLNAIGTETVSEEEKEILISEEEAKQIAISILEKLGYTNEPIAKVMLMRGYTKEVTSYYSIRTSSEFEKGLMIEINAKNGEFIYFSDLELKYKDIKQDELTEGQITQISKDVYNKIGLKEDEYELVVSEEQESYVENEIRKIYGSVFRKKYDGIFSPSESFGVSFIVLNGEIKYNTITLNNSSFEDNPVVILKEEAIKIAQKKEKEFTKVKITSISTEIDIKSMNLTIYELENEIYDIGKTEIYYSIEHLTRRVWKVTIEHSEKKPQNKYDSYNKYLKENCGKEYYVDATTGEIIGGKIL